MIKTPFTDAFDQEYLLQTMMGPNAMRITEELVSSLPISAGMRILDLGCGMGLSSIFLAQKYDATIFATDLWISPTDNWQRFRKFGLEKQVIPLVLDASKELPFAHHFFDMIISVDAYHYFGANETALTHLLPFLKPGGHIGVAMPGLQVDFPDSKVPDELQPFWQEGMETLHSCQWWQELWQKQPDIQLETCKTMACFKQAWQDWLQSPNPYAQADIAMMKAEAGKYFTLVQITARKNKQ